MSSSGSKRTTLQTSWHFSASTTGASYRTVRWSRSSFLPFFLPLKLSASYLFYWLFVPLFMCVFLCGSVMRTHVCTNSAVRPRRIHLSTSALDPLLYRVFMHHTLVLTTVFSNTHLSTTALAPQASHAPTVKSGFYRHLLTCRGHPTAHNSALRARSSTRRAQGRAYDGRVHADAVMSCACVYECSGPASRRSDVVYVRVYSGGLANDRIIQTKRKKQAASPSKTSTPRRSSNPTVPDHPTVFVFAQRLLVHSPRLQ
jgi:hypothetical protein